MARDLAENGGPTHVRIRRPTAPVSGWMGWTLAIVLITHEHLLVDRRMIRELQHLSGKIKRIGLGRIGNTQPIAGSKCS